MNSMPKKAAGLLLLFLAGAALGAGGLALSAQSNLPFCGNLTECLSGDSPQAQIGSFVEAILDNDRSAAAQSWEIDESGSQLAGRRESVIADLMAAGIAHEYLILDIEWWTTCCEPSVTCDSREAGGSRIMIQFLDRNQLPLLYSFDVFAREQPYWGGAAGYPRREWVIRDVYGFGQEPLFWKMIHESTVRHLQP